MASLQRRKMWSPFNCMEAAFLGWSRTNIITSAVFTPVAAAYPRSLCDSPGSGDVFIDEFQFVTYCMVSPAS